MSKDLVKILFSIALVCFFYFFVGDSVDEAGQKEVMAKVWGSAFLVLIFAYVSCNWWASLICFIEIILAVCGYSILKTWDVYDSLDDACPDLHLYAFVTELIILFAAFWRGLRHGSIHSGSHSRTHYHSIKGQRGGL